MKSLYVLVPLLFISLSSQAAETAERCYESWGGKKALFELKRNNFELEHATPQQLLEMRHCLAAADPAIRDGVAYEAFYHWLREELLPDRIKQELADQLSADIKPYLSAEPAVFQPFAVLVLSEVIRADRVNPFLSDSHLRTVVDNMTNYITSIRDYRGFDNAEGWRHSVAHSADVVLQTMVSQRFSTEDKLRLLNALKSQIAPESHFYHFGEPKRIARAVVYAMLHLPRESINWEEWLTTVSNPEPFPDWLTTYKSEAGLTKRHNVTAFLQSLLAYTHQAEPLEQYQPAIINRLISMK